MLFVFEQRSLVKENVVKHTSLSQRYYSCSIYPRTRDGTVVRTLASHYFGRVISRTLLFMSAEFVVDPRPNSNHFVENHTLGNVNFLFINFGLFSWCIFRLKKVFRQLWLQNRKNSTKKQNAIRKNCEILELHS